MVLPYPQFFFTVNELAMFQEKGIYQPIQDEINDEKYQHYRVEP